MTTKSELEQLVENGLAYRKGRRYFATPLAHAYQWASDNLDDVSDVPDEGIRYQGCLISKVFIDGEWAVNVSEIKQ